MNDYRMHFYRSKIPIWWISVSFTHTNCTKFIRKTEDEVKNFISPLRIILSGSIAGSHLHSYTHSETIDRKNSLSKMLLGKLRILWSLILYELIVYFSKETLVRIKTARLSCRNLKCPCSDSEFHHYSTTVFKYSTLFSRWQSCSKMESVHTQNSLKFRKIFKNPFFPSSAVY